MAAPATVCSVRQTPLMITSGLMGPPGKDSKAILSLLWNMDALVPPCG